MKKICVIFGGSSSEHDISIITALQLVRNIKSKFDIELIYFGLDNHFYLTKNLNLSFYQNKTKIKLPEIMFYDQAVYKKHFFKKLFDVEVVINCCHGGAGENGDLASLFEINNIPYTSSHPAASHIAMEKDIAKMLVSDYADVIKGIKVTKTNFNEAKNEILKNFSDDLIVKPNSLGSSIGVKACNKENFCDQIEAIFEMNDSALVENRIKNMIEFNQACIKNKNDFILSAIEQPISNHDFLTFDDKYVHGKTKNSDRILPANLPKELEEKINSTTKYIYEKLDFNGVVRIDYIYDLDSKTLYFNEANTIPGSMSFYLFEPIGIYISLVEILIENATLPKKYTYFNTNILNQQNIK